MHFKFKPSIYRISNYYSIKLNNLLFTTKYALLNHQNYIIIYMENIEEKIEI